MLKKNFAIIGSAGYVAEKHFDAIKKNNGKILAAHDLNDSMGKIDKYFPNSIFFKKTNEFKSFLKKNKKINYLVICTPNHLHYENIKMGLNLGLNIICEKPLVLNSKQIDSIIKLSAKKKKKVFIILQLRIHDLIKKFKKQISNKIFYYVKLTYITHRGDWYYKSWKGDEKKSGGIMVNIGIHLFDMLLWIFGPVQKYSLLSKKKDYAKGLLKFKNAKVEWYLSTNYKRKNIENSKNKKIFRMFKVNSKKIDLSDQFNDSHTKTYKNIINNSSFTSIDAFESLNLVNNLNKLNK